MNTMVFRCPGCLQPFQVMAEQAGQMVRCPGCQTTVQIPAMAPAPVAPQAPAYVPPPTDEPQESDFDFSKRSRGGAPSFQFLSAENAQPAPAPAPQTPAEKPEPYDCPDCSQAFGIFPSMIGTEMQCPHCTAVVLLRPKSERPAPKTASTKAPAKPSTKADKTPTKPSTKSKKAAAVAKTPKRSKPVEKEASSERSQSERSQSEQPQPKPQSEPKPVATSQQESSEKVQLAKSERRKVPRTSKAVPRAGQVRSVEDLLPPKFRAIDPDFFYRRHQDGAHVLLPSGDGEVKVVDNRIVKIEHNGETYELISSPEYDRVQKAIITNVLAVLICGLIIAIVMTLLNG